MPSICKSVYRGCGGGGGVGGCGGVAGMCAFVTFYINLYISFIYGCKNMSVKILSSF